MNFSLSGWIFQLGRNVKSRGHHDFSPTCRSRQIDRCWYRDGKVAGLCLHSSRLTFGLPSLYTYLGKATLRTTQQSVSSRRGNSVFRRCGNVCSKLHRICEKTQTLYWRRSWKACCPTRICAQVSHNFSSSKDYNKYLDAIFFAGICISWTKQLKSRMKMIWVSDWRNCQSWICTAMPKIIKVYQCKSNGPQSAVLRIGTTSFLTRCLWKPIGYSSSRT